MSSKNKQKNGGMVVSNVGWGFGYVIADNVQDRLFGNIFNIIEAIGLPAKQEEALKPIVKGEIWRIFEDAVFITPERHSQIREAYYQEREKAGANNVPMSAI